MTTTGPDVDTSDVDDASAVDDISTNVYKIIKIKQKVKSEWSVSAKNNYNQRFTHLFNIGRYYTSSLFKL